MSFKQKHYGGFIRCNFKKPTMVRPARIEAFCVKGSIIHIYNFKKSAVENHRIAAEKVAEEFELFENGEVLIASGWIDNSSNMIFVPVHPSDAARIVGQKRKKKLDAAA